MKLYQHQLFITRYILLFNPQKSLEMLSKRKDPHPFLYCAQWSDLDLHCCNVYEFVYGTILSSLLHYIRPVSTLPASVADPDPHLKSPPGSGSAWTDADPDPGGKKA